jgi:hypothetical protein
MKAEVKFVTCKGIPIVCDTINTFYVLKLYQYTNYNLSITVRACLYPYWIIFLLVAVFV